MFNKWLHFYFDCRTSEDNKNKCNSLERIAYEVMNSRAHESWSVKISITDVR